MFCTTCGREVSDDSEFCSNCGTKIVRKTADTGAAASNNRQDLSDSQDGQNTEYRQAAQHLQSTQYEDNPAGDAAAYENSGAGEQTNIYEPISNAQSDAAPQKSKKKSKKIKIAVTAAAAAAVVAVVGFLIYNSQPFFTRLFKGEDGHFTDVIEKIGESVSDIESKYEDVQAKITNNISYDFSTLAALASSMGADLPENIADLKVGFNEILEIDGKRNASRLTANIDINGNVSPSFSLASTGDNFGVYIEGLTKEYLSLSSLLSQYQTQQSRMYGDTGSYGSGLSSEEIMQITAVYEQLEKLNPIIKNYRDVIIKTVFSDEDNIEYESDNDTLGFKAYCYTITIEPDDIIDIISDLLEYARDDEELRGVLAEIIAEMEGEEAAEQFKEEYKKEISEALDEFRASAGAELEKEISDAIKEIEFTLWFDGQNDPLAASVTVNIKNAGKVSFEIRSYSKGGDIVELIQVKAAGQTVLKISLDAEESGSKIKGDFTVQIASNKIINSNFDLESFEIRGITLYDGNISVKINTEYFDMPFSEIRLKAEMSRKDNGMKTKITLSLNMDSDSDEFGGVSGNFNIGPLNIDTTVEALDEDLTKISFADVSSGDLESYMDTEGFKSKMDEWMEGAGDVLSGLFESDYDDDYYYSDYDDDYSDFSDYFSYDSYVDDGYYDHYR